MGDLTESQWGCETRNRLGLLIGVFELAYCLPRVTGVVVRMSLIKASSHTFQGELLAGAGMGSNHPGSMCVLENQAITKRTSTWQDCLGEQTSLSGMLNPRP